MGCGGHTGQAEGGEGGGEAILAETGEEILAETGEEIHDEGG